jgi:hypothetical protein
LLAKPINSPSVIPNSGGSYTAKPGRQIMANTALEPASAKIWVANRIVKKAKKYSTKIYITSNLPDFRNQKPETRNQKPETRNQIPDTRYQIPDGLRLAGEGLSGIWRLAS